jgi:hypothetical protein
VRESVDVSVSVTMALSRPRQFVSSPACVHSGENTFRAHTCVLYRPLRDPVLLRALRACLRQYERQSGPVPRHAIAGPFGPLHTDPAPSALLVPPLPSAPPG